jgi:hypothetical protein
LDAAVATTDELWTDWDSLNGRTYQGHPLLDSRFVRALLECFGTGSERLLTCRMDGRLAAAVIVVQRHAGLWETFLPSQAPIAPALLPTADLAFQALRHLPGFGLSVDFQCQDPLCSPFVPRDNAGQVETTPYADTMAITLDGGFAAYWQSRSKNLRKNISRYLSRMERDGHGGHLDRFTGLTDLPDAVARYGELESRGWKGRQGTAIHPTNRQGRFYASVMSRFGASGNAEVCELRVGGRLAASRLMVSNESLSVILKTTYDEELSDYAPGRLLLYRLLEHASSRPGPKRVEFYTKATAEQLAWATEQRSIFHARIFRWPVLRGAYRLLKQLRRSFAANASEDSERDTRSG